MSDKKEIIGYIVDYFKIIINNYKLKRQERIPSSEIFNLVNDLNGLIEELCKIDYKKSSELCTQKFIPIINYIIKNEDNIDYEKINTILKNAYRISARTSLKSYFIYREWEEKTEDKFYEPRRRILEGYIYYLEQIAKNPKFRLLIANLPSGYGKSYPEKISEAWNFGYDSTGTVLSLCSNEDVVKAGSRTVIDELKSKEFGEVFPNMAYNENDKNYFLKETESNWKLRDCKLSNSYIAKTTQSNVIGVRASQRVHIDDLYPDYKEALNTSINAYYINKYNMVWRKRFVQNLIPKIVITGTLWASGDFIDLVIQDTKKNYELHKHPKLPYTYVNEDETIAIIKVPALDYNTGLSVCPELRTTEEVIMDKNSMDEYLFQTNFQQIPTDPEALFFSYKKLRTYSKIPHTDYIGTYSVIDATRKSGKDFFSMPIFSKVEVIENKGVYERDTFDYYLKDCLFTRTATKDMYEEICKKIIEHHIIKLVIESNVTSELKQNIDAILRENGVYYCEILEKYNSENKKARINDEKGVIVRAMVFPEKNMYGESSQMGRFMNNLTLYNEDGRNSNDDAPDSLAMFSREIISGGCLPIKVKPVKRIF